MAQSICRKAKRIRSKGQQTWGTGAQTDKDVPLSTLVDQLNERLGTEFTQADQQIRRESGRQQRSKRRVRKQFIDLIVASEVGNQRHEIR